MFSRYLTYYSPSLQFVVFCAILSMCWLVGLEFHSILLHKLTGYSATQLAALEHLPEKVGLVYRWLQPLVLTLVLLVPALLFAYLAYPNATQYLGLKQTFTANQMLWGITFILIVLPAANWLSTWNESLEWVSKTKKGDENYDELVSLFLQGKTAGQIVINIFLMAVLPAFIEEVFFRGCLQQLGIHWFRNQPLAVVVFVAIIFSAFHFQWNNFIPRMVFGIILGLGYYATGSLWVSIAMHALNNVMAIGLYYLYQFHFISLNVLDTPTVPLWAALASGVFTLLVGYLLYKHRKPFIIWEVEKEIPPTQNQVS